MIRCANVVRSIFSFGSKVLSILLLSFAVYMLLMLCCVTMQRTELLRAADRVNIRNTIFYENSDAGLMTEKERGEEIHRIESLKNTDHIDRLFYYNDNETMMTMIQISGNNNHKYYLDSGTSFFHDEINKIILPKSYKDLYKVGNTITLSVFDKVRWISVPIALEVTGFLQEQPLISPYCGGNGISLDNLMSLHEAAIVSELRDSEGVVISGTECEYCLIYSKQGVDADQFHDEVSNLVDSPANVVEGNTIIGRYLNSYTAEYREIFGMLLLSLLLGITLLWGRMLILLDSEEKTMAVHYLCGSTWRREVTLLYFPVFIEIVFSTLVGNIVYRYMTMQNSVRLDLSLEMDPITILFVTVIMLLVYFTAIIPAILEAIRKSPIELYRED